MPGVKTTHIAYVYEDGSIYLPEGPEVVVPSDFHLASAEGHVHRLVREDQFLDAVVSPETVEAVARAFFVADFEPDLPDAAREAIWSVMRTSYVGRVKPVLTAARDHLGGKSDG